MAYISNLPNEIFLKVFIYLPFESVLSSLLVNRRFYAVLKANWKMMNTHFEVEKMTLHSKCFHDEIEISLNTASSGMIELTVKKIHVVEFVYKEAAKDTALVRAITHYFQQKGAYRKPDYIAFGQRFFNTLLFKLDRPLEELRALLKYVLPLIDIRKFVGEELSSVEPTYMDCIIRCIEDTSSSNSKGVPAELQGIYYEYPKLCRALRSPEAVFTDLSNYGISLLDTSLEIPIRVRGRKHFRSIAGLIREWESGTRSIFNFTSEISAMPISDLRKLVSGFDRFSIIGETETEILIELRRPKDAKILEIFYVIHSEEHAGGNKSEFSAKEI